MPETNNQLMNFQEFLMETLYSNDDIDLIKKKLKAFNNDPLVANWLKDFSPSMLEVAARMTQHWAKKD